MEYEQVYFKTLLCDYCSIMTRGRMSDICGKGDCKYLTRILLRKTFYVSYWILFVLYTSYIHDYFTYNDGKHCSYKLYSCN